MRHQISSTGRHLTVHAIEQFIRRWEPTKTYEEAQEELEALFRNSRIVGKTPLGDQIMTSGYRPEIRFVVKDRNVCVTVLPPGQLEDMDMVQLYEEELNEIRVSNALRIERLRAEIVDNEKAIADIDTKRQELAKTKSDLCNKNTNLKKTIEDLSEL